MKKYDYDGELAVDEMFERNQQQPECHRAGSRGMDSGTHVTNWPAYAIHLSLVEIAEIKERALAGETARDLADEFGVSLNTVYQIKNEVNDRWRPGAG